MAMKVLVVVTLVVIAASAFVVGLFG